MNDTEKPTETAETQAVEKTAAQVQAEAAVVDAPGVTGPEQPPGEIGGPQGPEPTRYGDWAFKGRCSDF